jgi:cell division protein FtsB
MQGLIRMLKNKFFLVSAGFLVWITFFAEYDLISQYKQRQELKEMKAKIVYLEGEIARLQAAKQAIVNDTATLEKYARENYFMKAANEDVYVIDSVGQNAEGTNSK